MNINQEVYNELYKIGMNKEDIEKAIDINVNLKRVIRLDIIQQINYLKQYNLTNEDILNISIENPWILTESFQRMRFLEETYKQIGIEDIREILLKYPIALSINPKELDDLVERLKQEGKDKEEIKQVVLQDFNKYFKL